MPVKISLVPFMYIKRSSVNAGLVKYGVSETAKNLGFHPKFSVNLSELTSTFHPSRCIGEALVIEDWLSYHAQSWFVSLRKNLANILMHFNVKSLNLYQNIPNSLGIEAMHLRSAWAEFHVADDKFIHRRFLLPSNYFLECLPIEPCPNMKLTTMNGQKLHF